MTLRRRFALVVAAQTAVLLSVLALLLFFVLQRFLVVGEEARLQAAFARLDADDLDADDDRERARLVEELSEAMPEGVHARVVAEGTVLAATPGFPPLPLDLQVGTTRAEGHQVLVRTLRHDRRVFTVQLAADLTDVREPLAAYLRALAVTVPAMIVVAALVAYAVAGRLLAPVKALERAARAIAAGGGEALRQPVPGADVDDELGSLARTLQASFRELATALEREREFTSAAAHDLRSPLTALRTRIQATLARPRVPAEYVRQLRELETDVTRLSSLAEHLLLLARDPGRLALAPVDLAALAGERVDAARAAHPAAVIEVEAVPGAEVEGDAGLLAHLLDNLLDNAVRHGGGAPVRVSVEAVGDAVTLRVTDFGPGVDEAELPHLARPFYRGDAARTAGGGGLGLAIVARIAALHGAELRTWNAPPGGLAVAVTFRSGGTGRP